MIMISDVKEQEMHGILSYYVQEVNKFRLQKQYNMANDYLDMLLGALSMYNSIVVDPLEIREYNNEIELIFKHVKR